jgi:hypothetical protein
VKKEDEEKVSGLPENAYRELKEGEVYKPILSPDKQYREVTPWSVFWGLVMAVLFSAAAAFLGLKGIRSRHPNCDHSSRIIQRVQT